MEGSTNPSKNDHYIAFDPWESVVEFSVYPYVDEVAEPNTDELDAEITFIGINKYTTGTPCSAAEINDPPSCSAFVTLSDTSTFIAERESDTFNFTRTGGDTTAPLTVNIRVDYLEDFLRGNHCDPESDIPTTVEFAANVTTQTITLTAPDDRHDLGSVGRGRRLRHHRTPQHPRLGRSR